MNNSAEESALIQKCEDEIKKHAYWLSYRLYCIPLDVDDLCQIGRLAVLEHSRSGVSDAGCALRRAKSRMKDFARHELRRLAYDQVEGPEPSVLSSPDAAVELEEHLSVLDPTQLRLVAAHLEGLDIRGTSARVGLSKSEAHRRLAKALETIHEHA